MNRKIWFVFTCFALLVSGYIVVQYFIMDGFQTGLVKAKLMFGSKLSEFWYSMLFTHITTSIVALVIGPFTLSTKFRERNINRHRIMGRIYMVGILLGEHFWTIPVLLCYGGIGSEARFRFVIRILANISISSIT